MSSKSSTGGGATARGASFEALCLAWLGAHCVAQKPPPASWLDNALVTSIGGQTGEDVDDAGALTDSDGWLLVQAKTKLSLSELEDSDLASALQQAVKQYRRGVPVSLQGQQQGQRPLDPARDRIVIVTNGPGVSTVRDSLANVVDRLATLPDAVPLDSVAYNKPETTARNALLGHVRRLWEAEAHTPPTDSELRAFLRVLRVRVLSLEEGEEDRQVAQSLLSPTLATATPSGTAWRALETVGTALHKGMQWMRRADVEARMKHEGCIFGLRPEVHTDVQLLRDYSSKRLTGDLREVKIPTVAGDVVLQRDLDAVVAGAGDGFVLVGAPGAGKTAVAAQLARLLSDQGEDMVYLPVSALTGASAHLRGDLGIQQPLHVILQGWDGPQPGTLILDNLDGTRLAEGSDWLSNLLGELQGTRWRVIATVRSFDIKNNRSWRQAFHGAPVDPARADSSLAGTRHLLVDDLTDPEIAPVRAASPVLDAVFAQPNTHLARLLRNPFNLRLAAELVQDPNASLAAIISQLDLLNSYWERRVTDASDGYAREGVLTALTQEMIRLRRDRIGRPATVLDPAGLARLKDILHDGVLREETAGGSLAAAPILYAHPVLFDYGVARLILSDATDPSHAASQLDQSPDLAVLARPSLDMHLAHLWHSDPSRKPFWTLALRLAPQSQGHPLAAAATAYVALQQAITAADLQPLIQACFGESALVEATTAQEYLAYQITGALDPENTASEELHQNVQALSETAEALAQRALDTTDLQLARTAGILLDRLRRADPATTAGAAGRAERARATVCLLQIALKDPSNPQYESLANFSANSFLDAVAIDPTSNAPILDEILAAATMKHWGVSVISAFARRFGELATAAPARSVHLAEAVWSFEETRDQKTALTYSQISSFTGTREGDLQGVRFDIGRQYPALLAKDLHTAVDLYLRILDTLPIDVALPESDARPRVTYGRHLRAAGGHEVLVTMTDAFVRHVRELATQRHADLAHVLQELKDKLHHSDVWNKVLEAAASDREGLGLPMAELLSAGDLLGSAATCVQAGHLLARITPLCDDTQHQALEQRILHLHDAETATGQPHLSPETAATLLAVLDRGRLADEKSTNLLQPYDAQGGPPALPPAHLNSGLLQVQDFSLSTGIPSGGRPTTLQQAVEAVRADLVATGSQDAAQAQAAKVQLRSTFAQLRHEFNESRTNNAQVDATPQQLAEAANQLVLGAHGLAQDETVLPDTELGTNIRATLIEAAPAPNATQATYSEIKAVEALVSLSARPDWGSAPEVHPLLQTFLGHPSSAIRAIASQTIAHRTTDSSQLAQTLRQRLETEPDDLVRLSLLRVLVSLIHNAPSIVDATLGELSQADDWQLLSPHPEQLADDSTNATQLREYIVEVLVYLAVTREAPASTLLLTGWLSNPVGSTERAERTCVILRQFLNPAPPTPAEYQDRTFALLALPLPAITQLLSSAPATNDPNGRAALRVCRAISRELYLASGASEIAAKNMSLGDPKAFADHALPVLDDLASVGNPAVTHDVINILGHLRSLHPRRVFLSVASAVTATKDYARELQGLEAVLEIVDAYLAEHRELLLNDPACMTALRRVLESFVHLGWEPAIKRAQELPELFR
ncbi:hypothetical protein ACFVXG_30810 [Kitasatospora sp. NPDC058162]|uniref:hypothetical protein n=1 Tax=Kitasatospora sp. NPDC058162 TaxID=3346362 RepID=UPI0036DEEC9C